MTPCLRDAFDASHDGALPAREVRGKRRTMARATLKV